MQASAANLVNLGPKFKVLSYNGGIFEDDQQLVVDNILTRKSTAPHCSKAGANWDLVLEFTEGPFTLTHFAIRGAKGCTAPIKDGLVFVSEEAPNTEAYTHKYDGFTREKYNTLQRTGGSDEPVVFFSTNPATLEFQAELPTFYTGRFLHLKFINRHMMGGETIDVGFVAPVGFVGTGYQRTAPLGPIPESLRVTIPPVRKFNYLCEDLGDQLSKLPICILFGKEEGPRGEVQAIAESDQYAGKVSFFWSDWEDIGPRVAQRIGVFEEGQVALVLWDIRQRKKYRVEHGKPINADTIHAFVTGYLGKTLTPFIKSQARLPNDEDPAHPGIKVVTANTFEELVLNSNKDVLLDVYADWCGPCKVLAPKLERAAELLRDIPGIVIAKMNSDFNDVDPRYLPETSIPNVKLFAVGKKQTPAKYNAPFLTSEVLSFVHKHASNKFDLAAKSADVLIEEAVNASELQLAQWAAIMKDNLDVAKGQLSAQEVTELEGLVAAAVEEVKRTHEPSVAVRDSLRATVEQYLTNAVSLKTSTLAKQIRDEQERRALKNVIKVHDDDEYLQLLEANKNKLVVVDFGAEWCKPCHAFAPHFADMSEEILDVVFLKVDVDVCQETAEQESIQGLPSIVYIKGNKRLHLDRGQRVEKDNVRSNVLKFK